MHYTYCKRLIQTNKILLKTDTDTYISAVFTDDMPRMKTIPIVISIDLCVVQTTLHSVFIVGKMNIPHIPSKYQHSTHSLWRWCWRNTTHSTLITARCWLLAILLAQQSYISGIILVSIFILFYNIVLYYIIV